MADEPKQEEDIQLSELNTMFVDALGDVGSGEEPEATEAAPEPEPTPEPEPPTDESPATEEPAEPVAADEPAPPEPAPDDGVNLESLRATANELGIDVSSLQSESEIATAVMDQMRSMQPEVAYARQVRQQAQQQAPQQQPEPEQGSEPAEWSAESYFKEKYGGPSWKPEYNLAVNQGAIKRTEEGLWTPSPGNESMAGIAAEMNQATLHREKFWQDLGEKNIYEQMYGVLKEPIERIIEDRVTEALEHHDTQASEVNILDQFERSNAHWLYTTDPQTGQTVYSEKGQELVQRHREAKADGAKNDTTALKWALKGFEIPVQAAQEEPPPPEKTADNVEPPVVNANQQAHNQPNTESDNTTGSGQDTHQQSFLDRARDRAEHSSSARGRDSDDAPQVLTEGDLDNLIVNDFKSRAAQVG